MLHIAGSGAAHDAFVVAVQKDPNVLRVKKLVEERGDGEFFAEFEPQIEDNQIWLGIKK